MDILNTIKESIINESSIEQYISHGKQHDWYYFFSDDSRKYSGGQRSESQLRKLYDGLSDDEKVTAAKWFKDNYPANDSSSHSKGINNWDVEQDGVDGFDGAHYSAKG